ncbi:MAG: phenylacetic acid degradation bifunctional protein PaaZ, partial [Saprospiraceae bacterium]
NYALGKWIEGDGSGQALYNAVTGEVIGNATTKGLDFAEMMNYARQVGNPKLRKMTFQERGLMLKALALYLFERKNKYYEMSYATGATRADSWIDIEGGIGNLFANASLRRQYPDQPYYVDGDMVKSSKNGTFVGHHIMVPKRGVAVHINAFNFPIWGMLEKIAVNFLAGMPAIVKPATITSFLTEAVVRDIIASGILPDGALQLLVGSARGIVDHAMHQDVITFTGSADTGLMLKSNANVLKNNVSFNMEADSLNSCVLGEDAVPGTPEFDIFIKEVRKEMTTKCGQKCTAIRKIIVPENLVEEVQIALGKQLQRTVIGDPKLKEVRMGALAGRVQVEEVLDRIKILSKNSDIVFGSVDSVNLVGADAAKGAFMSPILLLNRNPLYDEAVHTIEAFGPVSSIIPYKGTEEAIELVNRSGGALCCSIVTADTKIGREFTLGAATHHGRILILNEECAKESTGHGSPLPMLVHGGPGRAGGGEEMGGKRGVNHYMQRTAIQGSPTMLTEVMQQYQYGGTYKDPVQHPFQKYFEDLEVGETIITHKRSITEADIVNFANVSWDHFYAHTDTTSLEGTTFDQRVAHGYFILSAAAGLFVHPAKGPVLLNYGLEECRFVKPVYAGATIGVRLTVKEKITQEVKDDIPKGIVKFLVDVYDETGETVAIATILTMVKMKN